MSKKNSCDNYCIPSLLQPFDLVKRKLAEQPIDTYQLSAVFQNLACKLGVGTLTHFITQISNLSRRQTIREAPCEGSDQRLRICFCDVRHEHSAARATKDDVRKTGAIALTRL